MCSTESFNYHKTALSDGRICCEKTPEQACSSSAAEELCKTPSVSSCRNRAGALYPGPAVRNEHFPPWPADGTFFVRGFMTAKFCQVCHCQEWFSRLNTQRFFWVSNTVAKNTPYVQSVLNIKL